MSIEDFSITLLVDEPPEKVFDSINDVRGWWSEEIEGDARKLNDEFMYHYKDVHYCKMKVTELVPGKKITWLVLNNHFNFTTDQSEWKGTKICFEIFANSDKTEIRFTHEGLTPQYECYDICSNAWAGYINNSLRSLITTGKGQPNPKEGNAIAQ